MCSERPRGVNLTQWHQLSAEDKFEGGPSHETCCTLCGVPFFIYLAPLDDGPEESEDTLVWSTYFFALRVPPTTDPDSRPFLSGVGQYEDMGPRLPPPGYDIRHVLKGRKPMPWIGDLMTEGEEEQWNTFERIFPFRFPKSETVGSVYLMHPHCWEILLQQYTLVASPNKPLLDLSELARIFLQIPLGKFGTGFRPDWAPDYAGPEEFWWFDSLREGYWRGPQGHFLALDPSIVFGFNELLANPPRDSATNLLPRVLFTGNGHDVFSRLPEEILIQILVLLPSPSVRDLQLASKKMASVHLSSTYWRSRFEFPNELCHVTLPPALMESGQVGGQWVDWRRLCDQLLHPVGEEYGWWQNRKRITALNRQLVESMALRDSDGRLKTVDKILVQK